MASVQRFGVASGGTDLVLFATAHVAVGSFRCPPHHPLFRDSGPIQNDLVVFPRSSVWIRHEGARAFVADPTTATIYNRGQRYTREAIAPTGDRCDWLAVDRSHALEIGSRFDPAASSPERPFPPAFGPIPPSLHLRQRQLLARLRAHEAMDELEVEEEVLSLAAAVLGAALGARPAPSAVRRVSRDLAERARAELARGFHSRLSLADLARVLSTSPFHLCRTFRKETGTTLHAYRHQLRLRAALERLARPRVDLTELALDLGFSSHSHFTEAFRKAFGRAPSRVREALRASGRVSKLQEPQPPVALDVIPPPREAGSRLEPLVKRLPGSPPVTPAPLSAALEAGSGCLSRNLL